MQNRNKKNFDIWNIKKQKINNRTLIPQDVNVGEVYWFVLGINIGKEIDGKSENFTRPCLVYKIVTRTSYMVIPLSTSEYYKDIWHMQIDIIENKKSFLCFNQVKIIDHKRIKKFLTKVGEEDLCGIKNKFTELYTNNDTVTTSVTGNRVLRSGASAGAPINIIAEQDFLSNANFNLNVGDKYIHYKTKDIYEIINICFLQVPKEFGLDMEECVSYQKVNLKEENDIENKIWVRPIKMFLEIVKDENEKEVQRFIKIGN